MKTSTINSKLELVLVEDKDIINGEFIITEDIKELRAGCFRDMHKLRKVVIPKSVVEIGDRCFENCSDLRSVRILNPDCKIGNKAFMFCSNLSYIELPENLKIIGDKVLAMCSELKELIIPKGVVEIYSDAFMGCGNLTELIIPDSVEIISNTAFRYCDSVKKIVCNSKLRLNSKKIGDSTVNVFGREFNLDFINCLFSMACGMSKIEEVIIDNEKVNMINIRYKAYIIGYRVEQEFNLKGIEVYKLYNNTDVIGYKYLVKYKEISFITQLLIDVNREVKEKIKENFISSLE
jgi:hypothetical protein